MPIQLIELKQKYQELIELAEENGVANLKAYLNLDEFFLQAQRREDAEEGSLIKQRVDDKTYQNALEYVEQLLVDATKVIQLDFAEDASNLTDEQKANINKNHLENFFSNKARIKEGAKHVVALDKNRPSTKRYKKYFGWGLALTIFGSLMIAAVAVGIGIALGPALPVLAGLIGVIKIIGAAIGGYSLLVVAVASLATSPEVLFALLLPLVPVLGPLLGGAYLLRKAHTISKERQDLSLGLAQAFPALTKESSTNTPVRELSQNQLTQTIDAKLERTNAKLAAFEAAQKNDTPDETTKAYVESAVSYYEKRVQYLTTLKDDKDINSTILLLNRLKDRLDKTEDLTERNAVESEITAYKAVLGTFNQANRRTDAAAAKLILVHKTKAAIEENLENTEFMKTLPTVKSNDIYGRTRFFQFPHDLKYHQDHANKVHAEKLQAVTPSNQ